MDKMVNTKQSKNDHKTASNNTMKLTISINDLNKYVIINNKIIILNSNVIVLSAAVL